MHGTRQNFKTCRFLPGLLLCFTVIACGGGGGGGGSGSGNPPAPVTVPNVLGSTQAAASTSITGAGLTVGTVTTQSNASIAAGIVVSETPAAGSSAASGSAVTLVVSSGPVMVAVPNVVGDAQATAANALAIAGLSAGNSATQSSATVASGNVISESPAAGTSIAAGSVVQLVVSTGPATGTPTLGGELIGLASGGTVHVLNGSDNLAVSANGAFTLPTALTTGAPYNVTLGTQPSGQSCNVAGGSGTAASSNITSVFVYCATSLTMASSAGSYSLVSSGVHAQYDSFGTVTLDGAGNFSGSVTLDTNTVISTSALSGTYSVTTFNAIPVLTTNNPSEGASEFNTSAFATLDNNTGTNQPEITIGVRQPTNATLSSANGTYTSVSLESTTPPSSSMTTAIFNNGSFTPGAGQRNMNGTLSQVAAASSGTYTVSTAGIINPSSSGSISAAISADGDLIVGAPTTPSGNGNTSGIYILVKQGTGVTSATINGIYAMVKLATGQLLTDNDGKAFYVSMADGFFSGTYDENNAGTAATNLPAHGSYATDTNGKMTLIFASGQTLTGTVSADGNVFVLSAMVNGERTSVLLGIRQ